MVDWLGIWVIQDGDRQNGRLEQLVDEQTTLLATIPQSLPKFVVLCNN